MKIITSYNVRLKTEYISAMKQTVMLYTDAVRFYMDVILEEWNTFAGLSTNEAVLCAERLSHATTAHPAPKYDFDGRFPKFPCYLRRAAISSAFGKCCAYNSSLANWEKLDPAVRKKAPGRPHITMEMPAFYKGNMFVRTGDYTARLKLFYRNDWQYVDVGLRKCDVDYLLRHCGSRKESSPVLRHCHKVWELCFSYEEDRILNKTPDCMTSYFKNENYADGLLAAVTKTVEILNDSGEYTISQDDNYVVETDTDDDDLLVGMIVVIVFIVVLCVASAFVDGGSGSSSSGHYYSSGYSSSSSSSGSFGGGGASGGW